MKRIRDTLSQLLILPITIVLLASAPLDRNDFAFEYLMESMDRQSYAVLAYNKLITSFINDRSVFVHPTWYAGAFLCYDTLVIQIVPNAQYTEEYILDILKKIIKDHDFYVSKVGFSYNQLNNFGDIFVNIIAQQGANILSFGVDTIANIYRITVHENNAINEELYLRLYALLSYLNLPLYIEFAGQENQVFSLGSFISSGRSSFSVGLRGYYGENPALLTAGHSFIGADTGQLVTHMFRTHVGNLAVYAFGQHGVSKKGDWAVIALNETGAGVFSTSLVDGSTIDSYVLSVPVGAIVFGDGAVNRRWSGRIERVNQTIRFAELGDVGGITVTSGDKEGAFPSGGDSGGPVWLMIDGIKTATGVISGGDSERRQWIFSPLKWNYGFFRIS